MKGRGWGLVNPSVALARATRRREPVTQLVTAAPTRLWMNEGAVEKQSLQAGFEAISMKELFQEMWKGCCRQRKRLNVDIPGLGLRGWVGRVPTLPWGLAERKMHQLAWQCWLLG